MNCQFIKRHLNGEFGTDSTYGRPRKYRGERMEKDIENTRGERMEKDIENTRGDRMEERLIPFLIESERGHDEKLVPEEKIGEEIQKELRDGRWVTVEKTDGTTDLLTGATPTEAPKVDAPATEKKKDAKDDKTEEWQNILGGGAKKDEKPLETKNISSVTITKALKGG